MANTTSNSTTVTDKNNVLPPNPNNHTCYDEWCGWYTPESCDSFAGYLHNPYGYNFLTEPMKNAVDYAKNVNSIFTTIEKRLYNLLIHYFGDMTKNHNEGLVSRYNELHSLFDFQLNTIKNCTELIGLILWGADGSHPDVKIIDYTKKDGETISLTVRSICYTLINEYIKTDNVEKLCSLP